MKKFSLLKTLSFLFVIFTISFALMSCSSDKDEPELPGGTEFPVPTIPYAELPGSWLIESIKDSESGKTITINQEIAIGQFSPTQPKDVASDLINYEIWSDTYDDLISHHYGDESYSEYAVVSFYKYKKENLKTAHVGSIVFSLSSNRDGLPYVQSFILTGLSLSNGKLTSYTGAYGTVENLTDPISGTITMKKL